MKAHEHIKEAEGLLQLARNLPPNAQAPFTARAQVHATLALVLVTAGPGAFPESDFHDV